MIKDSASSAVARDLSTEELPPSQLMDGVKRLFRVRGFVVGFTILALMIFGAIFAPFLTPHDPYEITRGSQLLPPGGEHPLGTDQLGRDQLARILYGSRISLVVGLVAVAISGAAGTVLGLIAGYAGGWVDEVLGRLIDVMLAFPGILLTLLFVVILGPGLVNVMIAVGISRTPAFARLVRGCVLTIKENEFVLAARAAGGSDVRIMFRHILRNILAPLIVYSTLGVATAILVAASMGYLGLGAQPPTAEWGLMLSESRDFIRYAWWTPTFPGLAIMLSVMGINMMGDALRDTLDPRLRGR